MEMSLPRRAVFLFTSGFGGEVNDVNNWGGGSVMATLPGEVHGSTDLSPTGVFVDVTEIGADLRLLSNATVGTHGWHLRSSRAAHCWSSSWM